MKKMTLLASFIFASFLFCANVQAETKSDLVVNNIEVSSNNGRHKITATIKNIGAATASLATDLVLTYGTNIQEIASCTIGDCLVGDTYNASIRANWLGKNTLAPEEEYDVIFDNSTYLLDRVEFTNGANYLIKAIIDDEQTIDESDENNNIYSIFHNTIITSNHKLIKYPNDPKVYLVENNKKRWITSGDVFNAKKFRWDFIETISTSNVYDDGENLNSSVSEGDLIKYENDPKVYLVENNKKRWITSGDVFNAKGYSWSQIRILASTEADLENGTNISN